MKPYYQENGIEIYHGDCMEVLHSLNYTWDKWDLLLTDPPYGLGKKMQIGGTWATNPIYNAMSEWDEKRPIRAVFNYIISLTRNQIIWGGNYFIDYLWPTRCWLIWEKINKMTTMADAEIAWTNQDANIKMFKTIRNPDGTRNHPTQKPMALMQWCIQQAPDTVKTILDPFMGSGTTLVASKNLGRHCVGIDKEEKYCEIAAKRLAQGVLLTG